MKFLAKSAESVILAENLKYIAGNTANNRRLLSALLDEQRNFCAYTEQYILRDKDGDYPESVDVEHFTATKKGTPDDDYYNYYAVAHKTNIRKLDEQFKDATFHESRFFQNQKELDRRVEYSVADNLHYERYENDTEAREFIDFIQIDAPYIANRRNSHLSRLKTIRESLGSDESFITFLLDHKKDLGFITAIEAKFEIDLLSRL